MIECMSNDCVFGPRCRERATWRSPAGPLCDECAKEKIAAIEAGGTLLNILAAARGVSKQELVAKFQRIDGDAGKRAHDGKAG